MTKEEMKLVVEAFEDKQDEFELMVLKSQYLLDQIIPLLTHLLEMVQENERLEAENADLKRELAAAMEKY